MMIIITYIVSGVVDNMWAYENLDKAETKFIKLARDIALECDSEHLSDDVLEGILSDGYYASDNAPESVCITHTEFRA